VSSDGEQLAIRYKLNGTYKSDANYRHGSQELSSGGGTNIVNSQTGTEIPSAKWGVGNATLEHASGKLVIVRPFDTNNAKLLRMELEYIAATGGINDVRGSGTFDGTDAANALQGAQFRAANNFSGEIDVYGLQ
jgi:hypothetical protein